MQSLPIPEKIEWKAGEGEHEEIVTIEPCYPGYGTTLGNALRRVLFSSLHGAAPVAVKIKGVLHEFSTIPGVKEDVMEIIMAIKRIRFKIFSEEEVKLFLKASGAGGVKAKDIEKNSLVEIVNPSAHVATLTSKETELEMEIYVRGGRGYLAVEDRNREEREIGKILIDALFSPVINVGFCTENIRVGEMTNYERLRLNIITDGSLTPKEAFDQSVGILMNQLEALKEAPKGMPKETLEKILDLDKVTEEKTVELVKEEKPKKRGRKKKEE